MNDRNAIGEIDRIGQAILAADRLREDEIEQIACSEDLFAGVQRQIALTAATGRVPVVGRRPTLMLPAAAAFAAVIIAVAVSFYSYTPGGEIAVSGPARMPVAAAPPSGTSVAVPAVQPQLLDESPIEPTEPRLPAVRQARPVQASFKARGASRQAGPAKPRSPVPRSAADQAAIEFYALAATGSSAGSYYGCRIVRVDLPRASLVSLGANLPLDGDSPTVKTELLIGPDGVPSAIRLVK